MAAVIADPRVAAVTLTGQRGRRPRGRGARPAQALKKSVLELGGSDAFIVLADADLTARRGARRKARIVNNGQSCIAAKRFIVVDASPTRFVRALRAAMARAADGRSVRAADASSARWRGATCATTLDRSGRASRWRRARGCSRAARPAGPGYFYPPTVLADVPPGHAGLREETFGPVAAVIRGADEDEAIALANATPFGLGAACGRATSRAAERLARELEAGSVFINGMVASDPRLPFGGVKRSGYGRELGVFGLREFVNIKTV